MKLVESYQTSDETQEEVSSRFSVHVNTLRRAFKRWRETGSVELPGHKSGRPRRVDEAGEELIKAYVLKNPDKTLLEIGEYYETTRGVSLNESNVCRVLQRLGLRRKKKSAFAQEQKRDDVKKNDRRINVG